MKPVYSVVPFGLEGKHHIRKQEGGKVWYLHNLRGELAETTLPSFDKGIEAQISLTGTDLILRSDQWIAVDARYQGGVGVPRMAGATCKAYAPVHGGYPS